jgi:hypothetical protein
MKQIPDFIITKEYKRFVELFNTQIYTLTAVAAFYAIFQGILF